MKRHRHGGVWNIGPGATAVSAFLPMAARIERASWRLCGRNVGWTGNAAENDGFSGPFDAGGWSQEIDRVGG